MHCLHSTQRQRTRYHRHMRIVFITPDLSGRSGWSRYALDMGKALEQQGHELHCIVAEKTDTLWCRQYPVLRQPTSYLGNPLPLFLSALRLRSLLRKIRPDIVHFIAEPYALMLPFLPTASWKTCMTIHGTYAVLPFSLRGKVRQFFETAYRRCDRIVSVSHFTKNFVEMRVPAFFQEQNLSQKIVVLENAVDLTRFPYSEKKMSDAPVRTIISVSAVKQKKRLQTGTRRACAVPRIPHDSTPV